MPVLWRHHVPVALATFTAYNLVMLGPLVDVFVCSTAAVSRTAALYSAIDGTAFTLAGLLMPYPMQRPVAASPRAQVFILVLWLQLQFALMLPSVYLYFTESRCVVRRERAASEAAWACAGAAACSQHGQQQPPAPCMGCLPRVVLS